MPHMINNIYYLIVNGMHDVCELTFTKLEK